MVYVLLSVLAGTAMSAIFKITEGRDLNRNFITSVNYFAAVLVSFTFVRRANLEINLSINSFQSFFSELSGVLSGGKFSVQSIAIYALFLGAFAGILYFVGIIAMQMSVRNYGAGISGMFSRAGMIIPILLSILLWREIPSPFQWIGISLAIVGVIFANLQPEAEKKFTIRLTLMLQFITGGISALISKSFQIYGLIEYRDFFLLIVFFSAFLVSAVYTYKTPKSWGKAELIAGFFVGIFNQLSATFLLLALNALPAPIVYPMTSAGSIVFINIMGIAVFKEKLKKHEMIAIGLTIIAVIILS
jgi:multidrug transporter EmrE-like cation transporter